MRAFLATLFALFCVFQSVAFGQKVAGTWQGKLKEDKDETRLVIKIKEDAGNLSGEIYSIDEDGDPIALSSISSKGGTLTFAVAIAGINFSGHFSAAGNSIDGTWTDDKKPFPFTLVRANGESAWEIPKPTAKMARNANPGFEVATIKPSKPDETNRDYDIEGRNVSTTGTTLDDLIGYAYDVHRTQIISAPGWAESNRYDVAGVPNVPGEPNDAQMKSMMRKLLADRFQLRFHTQRKELRVYVLAVAKGGPKHLTKSAAPEDEDFGIPIESAEGGLKIVVFNGTMTNFAVFGLQGGVMDRPVLDKTGLTGRYDFSMTWLPDLSQFGGKTQMPAFKNPQPDIFTAIREQLGLTLTPRKTETDVMVVDHVERPSQN